MKKFLLTLLLTLSSAVAFAFSGSGTEADPYLIKTADDLYMIRFTPNAYYQLQNNIDLSAWIEENYSEEGWSPIGTPSASFTGTFDGNGFTIYNLRINRVTDYNGLFGCASSATVKNLTIKCKINGSTNTGAIMGSGPSSTISNCSVEGEVYGKNNTGGLIGRGSGEIVVAGCTYNGDVDGENYTGGIIGYGTNANLTVEEISFVGNVKGEDSAGGFVGDISKGTLNSTKCSFNGSVSGMQYTGGFSGNSGIVSVKESSFLGGVSGAQYTGGFLGNGGNVSIIESSFLGGVSGAQYTGGFLGNSGNVSIIESSFWGEVRGEEHTGGLCGYAAPIVATESAFIGNVIGDDYTGGLCGRGHSISFTKCAVEGSVRGGNYTGGVIGMMEQAEIYSYPRGTTYTSQVKCCYVRGDVLSDGSYVGGLIGFDDSNFSFNAYSSTSYTYYDVHFLSQITDCYYEGNIVADGDHIGGVCGHATGEHYRCYSKGTIVGHDFVGGIAGYAEGTENNKKGNCVTNAKFYSCVSLCSKIELKGNHVARICNAINLCSLGNQGSNTENRVISNCKVYVDEDLQKLSDSPTNGYEVVPTALHQAISYSSLGWDFTEVWDIDEGRGFPFLRFRQPSTSHADELVLTDASPAIPTGTYEGGKVKYSRICGGNYASFCLPFDVDLSAAEGIEKVYMPMEQILYNTQTQYLMMFLKEQDMTSTVKAGTPFLAKVADSEVCFSNVKRVSYSEPLTSNPTAKALTVFDFDGKSGVLYQNNTLDVTWGGTYVATTATTGLNSFNINGSFGQHSGTLSPYRAYVMQTTKSGANSNVRGIQLNLGDDEGEVTSIFQLLNAPATTESIYDMQGRRVLNPQQGGLYIINGKKVRL